MKKINIYKKNLFNFENILGKLESFFLLTFIFIMSSLSLYQIILRYFFNDSITWIDPLLRGIVLLSAMLGGAKAIGLQKSIKVDVLHYYTNRKLRIIIDKILNIFGFIICFILFIISCHFVLSEKEFAEIFLFKVKMWHFELIFPVSFFLMSFHFFVNLFKEDDNL